MGLDFYMAKRGRKTEEFFSGTCRFHCIRTYLMACFNVKLAKAYHLPGCSKTPEEKAMLQDISPYVPEGAWALFCSSDIDGEWDNATVKRIVREVKNSRGFLHPDTVQKEIEDIVSGYSGVNKIHLAGFDLIPEWKDKALEFIAHLEKAADTGCRVFWY